MTMRSHLLALSCWPVNPAMAGSTLVTPQFGAFALLACPTLVSLRTIPVIDSLAGPRSS